MAESDIRWSDPTVPDTKAVYGRAEAPCISDTLHVHVWPDTWGINIRTHGNTLNVGKLPYDVESMAMRVKPGPLYQWRTKRAIAKADVYVCDLKDKHATIGKTFWSIAPPPQE